MLRKEFWRRRRRDAPTELRPLTARSQPPDDCQELNGQGLSHGGGELDVVGVNTLAHKASQNFFEVKEETDLPKWQDCPPSPTTKSAIDSSPHSYSHREVHDLVNEHPSFQRAQIISTEIYAENEGAVAYNLLIVSFKIGTTTFYLRLDGRKVGGEFDADPFGVSSNLVYLTVDWANLALHGSTKLNRQCFYEAPTLLDLVSLLKAVHEAAAMHNIDSRLFCSLLQHHLVNRYHGSFKEGDNILPDLRRDPARAVNDKLNEVAYFQPPVPPLSDLLYRMIGELEPDGSNPKYEAFELSLELDTTRNFQNSGRRACAARLAIALHDLAMQKPVAGHSNVTHIWEHNVMIFRAIYRYDEEHAADLARSLYHYGCSLRDGGQHEGAVIVLREAVHIFEHLDDTNSRAYRPYLAWASCAYSESLTLSQSLAPVDSPRLIVSIEIGHEQSSVAVAYCRAGKTVLCEWVRFWPGQNEEPRVPSVVRYDSRGRVVECGKPPTGMNSPGELRKYLSRGRTRLTASRISPPKLYSDYLQFLISHTRYYVSLRVRHDPRSLFEEICEVVLSHADAESDRMQSFLRKAAASAGLNRVHILDKTHTAASIALSANKDVTLAAGSTVLLCDGGPSSIGLTDYKVIGRTGDEMTLEKIRSSELEDGVQTVNESFEQYFQTYMTWEGFSKNDIELWLPDAVQSFEQRGKREFTMTADSCVVDMQARGLNNHRLRIKKGVMHIKRAQAANFFESLVQKLTSAIRERLAKETIIILQGGLSDMPYVMESLRQHLQSEAGDIKWINGRSSHVGDIALGALDIALEGRVPGGGEAEHPTPRPTERKWPWSRGRGGGITCNIIAMHG